MNFVHNNKKGYPKVAFNSLIQSGGQFYQKIVVIWAVTFESCLVAHYCAASLTAVDDDKSLLGVGQGLYGAKDSSAVVGSVAGVDIHVKRAKTVWAVVS